MIRAAVTRQAALFAAFALSLSCLAITGWAQEPSRGPAASPVDPDRMRPITPIKETTLFNGRDLTGFYTFVPESGRDNDPKKIFTVEDGAVHVSGENFGYFATVAPYANYRVRFEVKWGQKKWPPREKAVRDAGVLVHVVGPDKVWPKSFECQVQENDFGDIFHIDGISSVVNGKRENGRVVRTKSWEKPVGEWNTVEVVVSGDAVTNIVNGHIVNVATQITRGQNGTGGKLNFGRIAFQSEGAEIWYRNIVVLPL